MRGKTTLLVYFIEYKIKITINDDSNMHGMKLMKYIDPSDLPTFFISLDNTQSKETALDLNC